jgi:hypothetical protein
MVPFSLQVENYQWGKTETEMRLSMLLLKQLQVLLIQVEYQV